MQVIVNSFVFLALAKQWLLWEINNLAQPQKFADVVGWSKTTKMLQEKTGCQIPLHPACCWFNKKQPETSPCCGAPPEMTLCA